MPAIGPALVFVQENAEQENARERAWRSSPEGLLPDPVLCQNSIHLERYKRAVDAAWTVGVRSKYSCGFPMVET